MVGFAPLDPAYAPQMRVMLLADAEIAKDDVEQIFDINDAGDAPEAAQREAEIFGAQLGKPGVERALQRGCRFFQGLAMPRPRQNRGLAVVVLRYSLAERRQ